ncbi:glucosamine-6-phosphate deaminase [Bacillus benzoevorans]|nr:glucosamine-6-phosphate deaminase [Bacillus benzoevorans]
MKVMKVKNYEELSKTAAEIMINKINLSSSLTLGLATGSTPEGLYRYLVQDHKSRHTSYEHVTTFNLDEYAGLNRDNENSYYYYMNHHLFNHINISPENVHLPNGNTVNLEEECSRYESFIEQNGGIDLQVLGIGSNGHIGFNEPGTPFQAKTHIVELDDTTRKANSRFFHTINEVPTHAVTMGIATIMKSREILLLISGKSKAEAFKRLIEGGISEQFPASILKQHPQVTIIVDRDAYDC